MRVGWFPSRLAAALTVTLVLAGCGGRDTPVGPSPSTRVIQLGGDLTFGTVNIGSPASRTITIGNSGNDVLSFSSVVPSAGNPGDFSVAPASGTIPPGGSTTVTVTYAPSVPQTLSGQLTVTCNATSGGTTIPFSATAIVTGPLFTMSGVGNAKFAIPTYVTKVHVVGTFSGSQAGFQVWTGAGGGNCGIVFNNACHLLVNDAIGTAFARTTSDNTLDTGGGIEIDIVFSTGVSWTVTEVR